MIPMLKPLLIALIACLGLGACSSPTNRVDLQPLQSELRRTAIVPSVMVRTVSLPTYAAAEEIAIQNPDGVIVTSGDVLWADLPDRAATLTITGHLNTILSAVVGPDPWPFVDLPGAIVEVRVTEMIAGNDGLFRLRGQYFIGGDASTFRKTVVQFNHTAPLSDGSVSSVATAQSHVLLALSEEIARSLSR